MENISDILHEASLMQFPSVANAAVSYTDKPYKLKTAFGFEIWCCPIRSKI